MGKAGFIAMKALGKSHTLTQEDRLKGARKGGKALMREQRQRIGRLGGQASSNKKRIRCGLEPKEYNL